MKRKSVLVVLAVIGMACSMSVISCKKNADTPPPATTTSAPQTTQSAKVYTDWPFDATEAARRQDETSAVLWMSKEVVLDLGKNVRMKLVLIPAGKFMMGCPKEETVIGNSRFEGESPQHEVTVSKPFYMGIYTVTQEQYEEAMGINPSGFKGASSPVEQVSWNDAVNFCKAVSENTGKTVRLPTEAQWEYACRAGTATPFNTGNTISTDEANYRGSQDRQKTTPVGSFKPNAFGLYDMHGNVAQWCSDWMDKSYYANSPKTDPQGPNNGYERVMRGGSFADDLPWCRSAHRGFTRQIQANIGFRVVVLLDSK